MVFLCYRTKKIMNCIRVICYLAGILYHKCQPTLCCKVAHFNSKRTYPQRPGRGLRRLRRPPRPPRVASTNATFLVVVLVVVVAARGAGRG